MSRVRQVCGRGSGRALALGWAALMGAQAGGCANNNSAPTSVFLEIFDAIPVASATDVDLDVYPGSDGGGSGIKLASFHRTAAPQTSTSAPLGSVVILAGADGGVGALRIQGRRSSAGVLLSQGSVDVVLVANRQIGARLDLAGAGQGDGGARDAGTDGDVAAPRDTGDTRNPADTGASADTAASPDRGGPER
jgi:hypothetical protein